MIVEVLLYRNSGRQMLRILMSRVFRKLGDRPRVPYAPQLPVPSNASFIGSTTAKSPPSRPKTRPGNRRKGHCFLPIRLSTVAQGRTTSMSMSMRGDAAVPLLQETTTWRQAGSNSSESG
jgi:hypothetical protein